MPILLFHCARFMPAAVHPLPLPCDHLQVDYLPVDALASVLEDPQVLAAIGFAAGSRPDAAADPRHIRIGLDALAGDCIEVWRSSGPVQYGRAPEGLRWARSETLQWGALEVDEADFGGDIRAASAHAYRLLQARLAGSSHPHLLRIWNYIDAIVEGEGDQERYRQFCLGRADGMGSVDVARLPAATAIGRIDGVRVLQVYWLAAREPGRPVENPRQVSAYHYPRQYGPQPPSFARAMLPARGSALPLMLSGTASVVGHASLHAGDTARQIAETFTNFQALIGRAREAEPLLPAQFGPQTRLKVYLQHADQLATLQQALSAQPGRSPAPPVLHACVCRPDLHVEIDGWHC